MKAVVLSVEESEAISAWSSDSRQRAKEILGRYPEKRSAVMPLLYVSMIENGYVTEDGMRQVAVLTGLSPAQVQAVASFYTMYKREPVGDYLVGVCTSISCFLLGADDVLAAIEDETGVPDGETDGDGVFSVNTLSATVPVVEPLLCSSTGRWSKASPRTRPASWCAGYATVVLRW